jgi:hypothetical protein
MSPVDERPAQVVSSPIINSRRKVMLCRAITIVLTTGALPAGGLMEAGSGRYSSSRAASEAITTVAGRVIGMNDHALASVPVYVTGKTSANTETNGNFSVASVTTSYDITVVDAANTRALISQGLSRQDPARTRFGLTSSATPHGTKAGKITGVRTAAAPADGRAEPTGFQNPTSINCAGGSIC